MTSAVFTGTTIANLGASVYSTGKPSSAMSRLNSRIRLTHKIAAIGATGLVGIAIIGVIYLLGTSIQDYYQRSKAMDERVSFFRLGAARPAAAAGYSRVDDGFERRALAS